MKIYCPKCRWEPGRADLWICYPGCHHRWNTFETAGRCPGCGKVWRDTECLHCARISKHHDWYHDLPPVDLEKLTVTETGPAGVFEPKPFRVDFPHELLVSRERNL